MKKVTILKYSLALLNFYSFTANAQTYCSSKGTNTTHGYIKKVSIETINNTSGNNGGYADFTAKSATLHRGATYTIELTPGFIREAAFFEYWTVCIDYNQNGIFDPDEIVAKGHTAIGVNKSFPIPVTALSGPTRMRIQMQEGSFETNPCATYTYGEVEDYIVVITGNAALSAEINSDFKNISEEITGNFRLYPNPVKDNLTVKFTGNSNGNVKVNVYNLSGQKVISIENPSLKGLNIYNLSTGKLSSGLYLFEMENNGQRLHGK